MKLNTKIQVRFEKEHMEIFKELIEKYNQAKSYQDLIISLVNYTLKNKYGITEVKEWPKFKFDSTLRYGIDQKKMSRIPIRKK